MITALLGPSRLLLQRSAALPISAPCGSLGGKLMLPSQDRRTGSLTDLLGAAPTWWPEVRAFACSCHASSMPCLGLSGEPQRLTEEWPGPWIPVSA